MDAVGRSEESAIALEAVPSPVIEVIWADDGLVETVNVIPSLMVRVLEALMTNVDEAIVLLEMVVSEATGLGVSRATTWEPTRILPLFIVLIADPPESSNLPADAPSLTHEATADPSTFASPIFWDVVMVRTTDPLSVTGVSKTKKRIFLNEPDLQNKYLMNLDFLID